MAGPGSPLRWTRRCNGNADAGRARRCPHVWTSSLEHFARLAEILWRCAGPENIPQTSGLVRRTGFMSCAIPALRRAAKARLCQIDNAHGAGIVLWPHFGRNSALPILARRTYVRGRALGCAVPVCYGSSPSCSGDISRGLACCVVFAGHLAFAAVPCRLRPAATAPDAAAGGWLHYHPRTAGGADRRTARAAPIPYAVSEMPPAGQRHHPASGCSPKARPSRRASRSTRSIPRPIRRPMTTPAPPWPTPRPRPIAMPNAPEAERHRAPGRRRRQGRLSRRPRPMSKPRASIWNIPASPRPSPGASAPPR